MSGSLIAVVSGAIGAALVLLCVLASAWCQRRRQGLQARRIMSMVAETSPSPVSVLFRLISLRRSQDDRIEASCR
eukprot:3032248-Pleurochrysis_carterae.AAC.2